MLVFLFSITMFLWQKQQKAAANDIYGKAFELATAAKPEVLSPVPATEDPIPDAEPQWVAAPLEGDPHIQTLADMDLDALRQVNPQVIGWILIPDTAVNYPLMQGDDNEYYLKLTWDYKKNASGSIFLEHLNSPDLTDFNTIVYGHNMNDGSMFAGLRKYRDQAYLEEHPYVYIRSDQGVYRYEIFSSYLAKVESNTYGLGFSSEASRNQFLRQTIADSVIDTGIQPAPTDRILTLSTCSGSGYSTRWVVHARLKMIPAECS